MDLRLPQLGPIASEFTKVALAVGLTEFLLWLLGLWSWVSSSLQRWPWLVERYAVVFPLILFAALVGLRRWKAARSQVIVAFLSGAVTGTVAALVALFSAQMLAEAQRARVWSSLDASGGWYSLALAGIFFALFLTLGWLYGAVASLLALFADRSEARLRLYRDSE